MPVRAGIVTDKSESFLIEQRDESHYHVVLVKLVDAPDSTSTERVGIGAGHSVNVEITLSVDGIQRRLVLGAHLALTPSPPPRREATLSSTGPLAAAAPANLDSMERAMIEKALKEARFNKTQAAKVLGLTRA